MTNESYPMPLLIESKQANAHTPSNITTPLAGAISRAYSSEQWSHATPITICIGINNVFMVALYWASAVVIIITLTHTHTKRKRANFEGENAVGDFMCYIIQYTHTHINTIYGANCHIFYALMATVHIDNNRASFSIPGIVTCATVVQCSQRLR